MDNASENGTVAVSTGVVFRIVDVPTLAFDQIKKKLAQERPKVPVTYIVDKDREESNPNDPDYLAAMEMYDARMAEELIDMAMILGTEIGEIPKGFPSPTDDSWTKKLVVLGIEVPPATEKERRYLAWMKLCAAPTLKDIQALILASCRGAGVTEEDVVDASAVFPSRAARRTNRRTRAKA